MNTIVRIALTSAFFATTTPLTIARAELTERPGAVASVDSTENAWGAHLYASLSTNVSPLKVTWDKSGEPEKIAFKLVVLLDKPRYRRQPLFPPHCSGELANLREALVTAKQPLEFQEQALAAGNQLTLTGSFVRRLDGKFSPVIWTSEYQGTLDFDPGVPTENSPYTQMLRDKIASMRNKQSAESLTEFIGTVGRLSGTAAALTGNPELEKVAQVIDVLMPQGTNGPVANPTTAASTPAPVLKMIEKGLNLSRSFSRAPRN